jgi:hypothetical protein
MEISPQVGAVSTTRPSVVDANKLTSEYLPTTAEAQSSTSMPFIPARLDDAALTLAQFRILCHIARRGQCYESGRNMAKACRINHITLWSALSFLERWKLVEKTPRPGNSSVFTVAPLDHWIEPGRKQHPSQKSTHPLKPTRRLPKRGPTHPSQKSTHEVTPSEGSPIKGGSPSSTKLYPREYDDLIATAKTEIERLNNGERTPEKDGAIGKLKEQIRNWKSEKLGVALPVCRNKKKTPPQPTQAPKLAQGEELKHFIDELKAAVEARP